MAGKKSLQQKRYDDFIRLLNRDEHHVRELREETLSNGDKLNFFQYDGIVFIVQRFEPTGGIEVYVSAPGNKTDFAAKFVAKTEELRKELDSPKKTLVQEAGGVRELNRILSKSLLGRDPYQ